MDEAKVFLDWIVAVLPAAMAAAVIYYFRNGLQRILRALASRIERGDSIEISKILTIGESTGKLKRIPSEGVITDDHLSLIHRSWRVPKKDKEFGGQAMYQFHLILFAQEEVLDKVEYVKYKFDKAYTIPVQFGVERKKQFGLYELANGYSLVRAEVKMRNQAEVVNLSRFVDLAETSDRLKGRYLVEDA
jgi:hypothetical protein